MRNSSSQNTPPTPQYPPLGVGVAPLLVAGGKSLCVVNPVLQGFFDHRGRPTKRRTSRWTPWPRLVLPIPTAYSGFSPPRTAPCLAHIIAPINTDLFSIYRL